MVIDGCVWEEVEGHTNWNMKMVCQNVVGRYLYLRSIKILIRMIINYKDFSNFALSISIKKFIMEKVEYYVFQIETIEHEQLGYLHFLKNVQ